MFQLICASPKSVSSSDGHFPADVVPHRLNIVKSFDQPPEYMTQPPGL